MLNDNKSDVNKISRIKYTFNKKHSSIYYHLVIQNVAAGAVKIGWILTADNIADVLTKRLTEPKRKILFLDWNY